MIDLMGARTGNILSNMTPEEWDAYQRWNAYQQQFYDISKQPAPVYDPSAAIGRLEDVGAYQPYQYTAPQYQGATYAPYQYNIDTDYRAQYQAPDAFKAYQFQAPEIAALERVNPIAQRVLFRLDRGDISQWGDD